VAVNNLNISSTHMSLDSRAIRAQPRKHLKFTFPMVLKSLFLVKKVSLRFYVDISADSHVVPEGTAENYGAIGVVLADHE